VAARRSAPPPGFDSSGSRARRRLTAIFHLAEVTGPARTLAPRLERLAEDVDLDVVLPGVGAAERLLAPHARVTRLPYAAATFPSEPATAARAATSLAREVVAFRRHFRDTRPDAALVVSTVLPAAMLAARLERVPLLVYAAEILERGHVGGPFRRLAAAATARLVPRLATAVVACSRTVAAQFGDSRAAVRVVYPGISPLYAHGRREHFRPAGEPGPWIAVVGAITPGRGQDVAVRSVVSLRASSPGVRLLLAGAPHPRIEDRRFENELRTLARDLGVLDEVSFLGHVDDVADVYAAADVVVNPARFNEPFGRVALEALVAGRPVVATRVGAIPEVLRDGRDALLVPPDDPEAIAGAVLRLGADDAQARALVEQGRERVAAAFSEEAGIDAFRRAIDAVLDGR
jgi:glycosyltransferase involved in cell wall biosynthesis